jgi:hypothetical protein
MRRFAILLLLSACGSDPAPPPLALPAPIATHVDEPKPPPAVTERRSVVVLGRTAGTDIATTSGRTKKIVLDVLENGRGPHVEATVRYAADKTLSYLEANGHHETGNTVRERFTLDQGDARWTSLEESGRRSVSQPLFFYPIATLPDALGMLAEALLANGNKLGLLPDGEASIRKVGEATLPGQKHIVGYEIDGLGLAPEPVWMNDDGTWFGTFSAWESVVPEGYESAIDSIVAKQDAMIRERDARLAGEVRHVPPKEGLAFTHVRVLAIDTGKYLDDQTVLVVGPAIKKVGARVAIPKGAEVIDAKGKTLLPGLWDMHAHLGNEDGVLNIASGVTSVRDVGNDPDKLDDYKKRFDEGTAIGPHVYRFGFIEGRNEKAASSKVTAENEAEAKAAVETFRKRGYDGIKIYNSIRPELVPILAAEAHAKKMLVTGHIPVHMLANEAVRAGYDGIEHINMLFLNFLADHETDTRTTLRFTLVGDKGHELDLAGKPAMEFFALLAAKKTVVDPTVSVFQTLLLAQQGKVVPGLEPLVERLPVQTRRTFLVGGLPLEGGKEQTYRASFEKVLAMVKKLRDQKIAVVAGTDALAGLTLHHELALFVRAGFSPLEALRAATTAPAAALRVGDKVGVIADGKAADLVLVDGDPLARIEDVGHVVTTVRAGVTFASPRLYESVSVKPLR